MNTILRITLLALVPLVFCGPLWGQPQISQAIHQPQIGDQVIYTVLENVPTPPISSGPNSVWNYTLQPHPQGYVDTVRYGPAPITPNLFSNSTLLESHSLNINSLPYYENYNNYFIVDGQGMHFEGYEYVPGGADNGPSVFDTPASRLRWPMDLNSSYSDSVGAVFYGIAPLTGQARTYLDVPGTGTLNLNGTTYNDVVCVHEYATFNLPVYKGFDELWSFYATNERYPLMTIRHITLDNVYLVTARNSVVLSRPEPTPSTWAVYPNPIRDRLSLRTEPGTQLLRAEVYDMQGKWVGKMTPAARHGHWEVPATEWKSGLYLIVAEDADGNRTLQKVLKE